MSQIHLIKGISPKKNLGQNFLINDGVIEREISYCRPDGKRVLEIGPGLGALTVHLASRASHLTAIEIDSRIIPLLREKVRGLDNVAIINGDFLKFEGGQFDLIVSNVPYYIASKIVLRISKMDFDHAVICIQRELSERMLAKPGTRDYSRFSVMCQMLFEVELLERVPKEAFYPKPKVQSSIIRLRKKGKVPEDLSVFINAIFQHRNKKLCNSIVDSRAMLELAKDKAKKISLSLSLCNRRVITLSKEEVLMSFGEYTALK